MGQAKPVFNHAASPSPQGSGTPHWLHGPQIFTAKAVRFINRQTADNGR
jgi:hypothetical protein